MCFQHKRLRERIWVLPIPTTTIYQLPLLAGSTITSTNSNSAAGAVVKPSPISPASPFEPPSTTVSSSVRKNSLLQPLPDKETSAVGGGPELALELEFEQLWETIEEEQKLVVLGNDHDDVEGQVGEGGRKRRRVWELSEEEKREMKSERNRCFSH